MSRVEVSILGVFVLDVVQVKHEQVNLLVIFKCFSETRVGFSYSCMGVELYFLALYI
jgi:hypothetical protein